MIALAASTAIAVFDLELLDDAMVCLPLFMIVIALGIGAIAWIVFRPRGLRRVSEDDPYFFPVCEGPVLPHQIIPYHPSAGGVPSLLRNESGGRGIPSPRSSAAVLTISKGERDV